MKNVFEAINPWMGFEKLIGVLNSKKSLLVNYKKINELPFKPRFYYSNKSDLIVFGLSIFNKLDSKLQNRSHVFIRPRDPFRFKFKILKIYKNFTFDLKTYSDIYSSLQLDQKKCFYFYKKLLHKINPKILIIHSTIDPVQRLLAFWAKELNIKIVCIQHGVFSSLSVPEVKESNIVDYYLSFGRKQSELIKKVIPLKKHIYLFKQKYFYFSFNKKRKLRICIIGTDHERYGKNGKTNKLKILSIYSKLIKSIYKKNKNKIDIFYKKHPSEIINKKFDMKINLLEDKDLNDIDVFIGIASTLLMKMASKKVCAIQIKSEEFIQDSYEEYGFCKTMKISRNGYFETKKLLNERLKIPYLEENKLDIVIKNIIK